MSTATVTSGSASGLGAHRALALSSAHSRSRLVRGLRIAIYALMAVIALNALIQVILSDAGELANDLTAPDGESERIVNPRFTGRDQDGTAYVVTAEAATRRSDDIAITELERPRLDYALIAAAASDPSAVLAEAGVFDAETRVLTLQREVSLQTRSGYAFSTPEASLHLTEARVSGARPVYGEAPWGRIHAGAFSIFDNGARVEFTNGVRTRIFISATDQDQPVDETGSMEDLP
ncbi:MAG: LPS export ABC transporter periplasmic protein LptC [Pseudomonadota bacterium]